MRNGFRIDFTGLEQNKGQIGGLKSKSPDPSPEEISAACQVIQMGWSERERWTRSGMGRYRKVKIQTLSAEFTRRLIGDN